MRGFKMPCVHGRGRTSQKLITTEFTNKDFRNNRLLDKISIVVWTVNIRFQLPERIFVRTVDKYDAIWSFYTIDLANAKIYDDLPHRHYLNQNLLTLNAALFRIRLPPLSHSK